MITPAERTFSVVIPTQNRPTLLRACLDALSQQEYPQERFEVVVVNDKYAIRITEIVSPLERIEKLK